ncbi:MAG TPA: helix-turn-helix transcriptional regulator [Thermoanaerobaculia bacterium]|nr:helix-turn-helix transcriptional regulator [Thermoanaerobaculia bacterium]
MPKQKSSGELLRDWRIGQGLTQTEAAVALGYSWRMLVAIERGDRKPELQRAIEIEEKTDGEVPADAFYPELRRFLALRITRRAPPTGTGRQGRGSRRGSE